MTVIILIVIGLSVAYARWKLNLSGRPLVRGAIATFFVIWGWFVVNEILSPGYVVNFWVALDIFANTVLWGNVETISERLGRAQAEGGWFADKFCGLLDVLFAESDHCLNAGD